MLAYVDHVLAILPFEPSGYAARLGGPATTYVGHRLMVDPSLVETRRQRALRVLSAPDREKTTPLLPGSRSSRNSLQLLPVFEQAALELSRRSDRVRCLPPTGPSAGGVGAFSP